MLEQIKHNKIKNTGIIYQILVKKMIEQAMNHQKPIAYNIFNNYFSKNKVLGKELGIYNIITNNRYQNQNKAKSLFEQALNLRMSLDDIKLDKEKFFCIKQIKKHYNLKDLFSQKVDNYKVYASIYKVFESLRHKQYNPVNIVESKYKIIQYMMKPIRQMVVDQDMQQFKNQTENNRQKTLQIFVQKFNQKYSVLNQKQKTLLQKYIYSMANSEAINKYMDDQLSSIKNNLSKYNSVNLQPIMQSIQKIKGVKIIEDKMYSVLNLYQLQRLYDK